MLTKQFSYHFWYFPHDFILKKEKYFFAFYKREKKRRDKKSEKKHEKNRNKKISKKLDKIRGMRGKEKGHKKKFTNGSSRRLGKTEHSKNSRKKM